MIWVTNKKCSAPPKNGGFTLIELLVTIGIVAILMMIAVPNFQSFAANQRVRSTAAELLSAMNVARAEAVKRNAVVTVDYDGVDWVNGWEVELPGGDPILTFEAQIGVTITPSAPNDISYGRDGRLTSASVNFTIAPDPASTLLESRCLRVALSGKPKVDKGGC